MLITPPALRLGDVVGIAAPASHFDKLAFEKGVSILESFGFKTKFHSDIFSKNRYLAGDDFRRAHELMELFTDPEVKAVCFARGGYGCLRILPLLNSEIIAANPKRIIGYSDITTLLLWFHQKLNWQVFHGPVVAKSLEAMIQNEPAKNSFLKALTHHQPWGPVPIESLKEIRSGTAEGVLVGGCLSLIVATLGTPEEIDTQNKILFLEDVNEPLYKIDRMFHHLKQAKKLSTLKGLILGPFEHSQHSQAELEELILEIVEANIPIMSQMPAGHITHSLTLPLGGKIQLDSSRKKIVFLE